MSEAVVIMRHPGEAHASRSGTVLIIDDEAAIRESLETLLELEGYAVESASSGEEGLARLGDGSFDLVLNKIEAPITKASKALFTAAGGFHCVALKLQQSFQRFADGSFVVDDQHCPRA